MIIKTKYQAAHRVGKSCTDEKIVQPNRSLSIRQVIDRFASGQNMDIPPAQYGRVERTMNDYDLADRVQDRRRLSAEMAAIQAEQQAAIKAQQEAARKKEIDDAVAARLAEKEQNAKLQSPLE